MSKLAARIEVTYLDGSVETLSLTEEYFIHHAEVKKVLESDWMGSDFGSEEWNIYTESEIDS